MPDHKTTIQALKEVFGKFVADRDWQQFHSPKNLAMSLAVEAAELMEHFLWMDNDASRQLVNQPLERIAIAEEIADVSGLIFCLCNALNLDLSEAIVAKMQKNVQKYPAEKYRGRFK